MNMNDVGCSITARYMDDTIYDIPRSWEENSRFDECCGNHNDCDAYCRLHDICLKYNKEDTENPCDYCEWYDAEDEKCTWTEDVA